jgi:hypothetical protein
MPFRHRPGVTLGAIAAALLVAACATQSAPPATRSAAPPTGTGAAGWHRVTSTPAQGATLSDVVADGPGVVAVGSGGLQGPGLAWQSADGVHWTAGPSAAALATTPLFSVGFVGSRIVEFGLHCSVPECGVRVAVSASPPGAWVVGAVDRDEVQSNRPLVGPVSGGPPSVAVGLDYLQFTPQLVAARVWTSADGVTWSVVPDGPAFAKAEMLAVGAAQTAPGFDACVWTSPDGLTWTREPEAPAFANGSMAAITTGGPGYVAVGTGANGAAVWTSPDARTWTRVADGPGFAGAQLHGVAAGPAGIVAVGHDSSAARIWTSADGSTWQQVPTGPDFADAQALSVAALGKTFVAVGQASPAGNTQAYVWVGP